MRVTIRPATPRAVVYVARRLRDADKMELETASGLKPPDAVLRGVEASAEAYTAHIDGEPAVVFGVTSEGVVWMVCTDAVRKVKPQVLELSTVMVRRFLQSYPRLWNQADCRNTMHIRWLQKLGATLDEIVEVNGHPFQRFHIDREEWQPCASQ